MLYEHVPILHEALGSIDSIEKNAIKPKNITNYFVVFLVI